MSKCECKKCIHEKVCRTREFPSIDEILKDGCPHYKDKSLFVELPVKLGQICYALYPYKNEVEECRVSSLTQKADGSWKIRLTHNHSVFEITLDKIGKTVFLTKEEAKQKLKELESI